MKFETDGHTKTFNIEEIHPGMVVRRYTSEHVLESFSDCIVLGVGKHQVKLARPYARASGTNTCCPTPLVWAEVFDVSVNSFVRHYEVVLLASGNIHQTSEE